MKNPLIVRYKSFILIICGVVTLLAFHQIQSVSYAQNTNTRATRRNMPPLPMRPTPTPTPLTSTIRGRAFYADSGTPLRRQSLMLLPVGQENRGRFGEDAIITGFNGEFEIKGVPEGKYVVSANAPNIISPFGEFVNEALAERGGGAEKEREVLERISKKFDVVTVIGGVDADVNVAVRRGGAIGGRVLYTNGEPAIGVSVEILRRQDGILQPNLGGTFNMFSAMVGMQNNSMKTDDRGYFRSTGLETGEYVVRVVENAIHSSSDSGRRGDRSFLLMLGFNPTSLINTFYGDTTDSEKATVLKLEAGQEITDINITLAEMSAHQLMGKAVNKLTQQPLKRAEVQLLPLTTMPSGQYLNLGKEFAEIRVTTDDEGKWAFKDLPRGQYSVEVTPNSEEGLEAQPTVMAATAAAANVMSNSSVYAPRRRITPKLAPTKKEFIIEEADITDAVIELGAGATVSGIISVENNQTLPESIYISLHNSDDVAVGYSDGLEVSYDQRGRTPARRSAPFEIEGISTGNYSLSTSGATNYEYDNEAGYARSSPTNKKYYIKSVRISGREVDFGSINISEGEKLRDVQVILSTDMGTLKGTVSDFAAAQGKLNNISILSTNKALWYKEGGRDFARISEDGTFTIEAAPGEYFVYPVYKSESNMSEKEFNKAVKEKGLRTALGEWYEKKTKDAVKVVIEKDKTATVKLSLPRQ